MTIKLIAEGIGLGLILVLICAFGIKDGAVGMVHFYHKDVQDRCVRLGLTTHESIKKRAGLFKAFSIPAEMIYVLSCVYLINGARGFAEGALQIFVILSVMNLIDRFFIDEYWVGHTKAWLIPGTEDMRPYIDDHDKMLKWLMGTVGMACISLMISGIMSFIIK
ncbi:MAG: hypothetical protein II664_04105 [Oscillospiraceae bacterium]|nr:hypothetical protein [Oscillospiraceae bacterium]